MSISIISDFILSNDRKNRFRVFTILFPIFLAFVITYTPSGFEIPFVAYLFGLDKRFLIILSIFLAGLSFVSLMMVYLQTGFKTSKKLESSDFVEKYFEFEDDIKNRFNKIEDDIKEIKNESKNDFSIENIISEKEKADFILDFKKQVIATSTPELISEFKATIIAYDKEEFYKNEILSLINQSKLRLQKEILELGRRANLNLSVGCVASAIGLLTLGWGLYSGDHKSSNIHEFLYNYFPRISFVVLVEIFAFFFLSLYKTSLSEIKYFQNEITNIDVKNIALVASIKDGNKEILVDVLKQLASTERNFILKKGQTTVHLENQKIDNQINMNYAKLISDLLKRHDK